MLKIQVKHLEILDHWINLVKYFQIIMFYCAYILKSKKDGKYYTDYTRDLKLRFGHHNQGLVESTRNRQPLELIYYEACLNQQDATHREKYLKTYYGKMYLKNRLKSYLTG